MPARLARRRALQLAASLGMSALRAPDARAQQRQQGLAPLHRALRDLEAGRRDRGVFVACLGDSHTEAGSIAARLQIRFDQRFNYGGVVIEKKGIVGGQIDVLLPGGSLEATARAFLRHGPSLIILAFGTNEANDPLFDRQIYRDFYTQAVDRLRQSAPSAALLLVGPPDAARISPSAPRGCTLGRAKVCQDRPAGPACRFEPLPHLREVRAIQQTVAKARGLLWWDWSGLMGGACGADRWARFDPPLYQRDRVHLTRAGYTMTADAIFALLMRDYQDQPPPP